MCVNDSNLFPVVSSVRPTQAQLSGGLRHIHCALMHHPPYVLLFAKYLVYVASLSALYSEYPLIIYVSLNL